MATKQLTPEEKKGPIAWMATNSVAANLVMFFLLIGGLIIGSQVKQEIFPEFDLDIIRVQVPYPGASPSEVEQGILLSIEDEVRSLDGVKEIKSSAVEGSGTVLVEVMKGFNSQKLLQDVKNRVDSITSFPEDAERPIVSLSDTRQQVISVILYGQLDETVLRALGERVRDELLLEEDITLVELSGIKPLEIGIEIPKEKLREYGLTLDQAADIIGKTALELPGGGIKTEGGEILLRTQERRDWAREFADIPLISQEDGTKVLLGEIATLKDGFEDVDREAFFNGEPAVRVEVFRIGDQTPIEVADAVKDFVEKYKAKLPDNVKIATWADQSQFYRERINLLLKNACLGLVLVLILLGLFLEPRLAFWVTMGIPISIIGSFLFIPVLGATINMVTLFAFIVTLGIIVDDAVVVGEIVYQKREEGYSYLDASILGAKEIAGPVVFAVLTNICAFLPLFFVPGATGKIFFHIPAIVVSVFMISLLESLFILPAHLSHRKEEAPFWKKLGVPRKIMNRALTSFTDGAFSRWIKAAITYRYVSLAGGIALIILTFSFVAGGHISFTFLPKIDSDLVAVSAELPFGTPIENSRKLQNRLVRAAQEIIEEQGGNISRGIYTQIGTPLPGGGPPSPTGISATGGHIVGIQVFLVPSDERKISGLEFSRKWREKVGKVAGIRSMAFDATIASASGHPIEVQLTHSNRETLEHAAEKLAVDLTNYDGVIDISSGVTLGKAQYSFQLTEKGRSLGLTARDLARQIRASFYGAEALRQQRGRNEVKVLVRLPENERRELHTLEEFIVLTPTGGEIPLYEAAHIERGRSYVDIQRVEGRRVVAVTADVDEEKTNANLVLSDMIKTILPELKSDFPGLSYSFEGEQKSQRESMQALFIGFGIAMIGIYCLLAIPFESYLQPAVVMLSIPFGMFGAILGHLLLGYGLSIISMFGLIALSGVVVNDSLVLIVTANRLHREKGLPPFEAIHNAALTRLRPILLTSLTTFFGLAPMIFETSLQARFLIPMAISLGFGILFSTAIILIITPAVYLIIYDIRQKPVPADGEAPASEN